MNEKALDIAERIVDRARAINEASVNVFVYSKLLQGYCSSNQRKEAFALLGVCTCHSSKTCIWVSLCIHVRATFLKLAMYLRKMFYCLVTLFSRSSTDIYQLSCKHLNFFLDSEPSSELSIPPYYIQRGGDIAHP